MNLSQHLFASKKEVREGLKAVGEALGRSDFANTTAHTELEQRFTAVIADLNAEWEKRFAAYRADVERGMVDGFTSVQSMVQVVQDQVRGLQARTLAGRYHRVREWMYRRGMRAWYALTTKEGGA